MEMCLGAAAYFHWSPRWLAILLDDDIRKPMKNLYEKVVIALATKDRIKAKSRDWRVKWRFNIMFARNEKLLKDCIVNLYICTSTTVWMVLNQHIPLKCYDIWITEHFSEYFATGCVQGRQIRQKCVLDPPDQRIRGSRIKDQGSGSRIKHILPDHAPGAKKYDHWRCFKA